MNDIYFFEFKHNYLVHFFYKSMGFPPFTKEDIQYTHKRDNHRACVDFYLIK